MTKKGEITGVSVNDLSNVELRIMAANLKHAEEGGPVPALRLGERFDPHAERAQREGITPELAKMLNFGYWYGSKGDMFK